jgi:hypothetical protein
VVVGGLGALMGIVLGPFLAGLTLSVPAGDPFLGKRWWRGGEASARRVAVVAGLAAVAPAKGPWLYYVLDGSHPGHHVFTDDRDVFNAAKAKCQAAHLC